MSVKVKIGNIYIGGGESIKVQSMTTFSPKDTENCIKQIKELEKVGCEVVRFSVKDEADAKAIPKIKNITKLPLVADIHFNYKLGILSLENGVDKIRINPGNIGGEKNVLELAHAIKMHKAAVRVGSNSGSVEKKFLEKFSLEDALVESALEKTALLSKHGVDKIVLSVKASDVAISLLANRKLAKKTDLPLHLGITEAGAEQYAVVKSAVGIGALLLDGIGDTIRVSLSGDPVPEVIAAKDILRAAGKDKNFIEVIACPTCGRCEWDCAPLAKKVQNLTQNIKKPLKIAVMGCAVNGPGEAKGCDLGIAGGASDCLIFTKDGKFRSVDRKDAEIEFLKEIEKLINAF